MKLEMFYDYACPYCLTGHEYLLEVLKDFPEVELVWYPCEAHPRPEVYGRYSDLCARGMYVAADMGADLMDYHMQMYKIALGKQVDIEDAIALGEALDGLVAAAKFAEELGSGKYVDALDENNRLVWDVHDCPAVPSFRNPQTGELYKSVPGVGVTKEGLTEFIRGGLGK